MYKCEMDPANIVENAECTWVCLQTETPTDGQRDKVKPVYPHPHPTPQTSLKWGYNYHHTRHKIIWKCWYRISPICVCPALTSGSSHLGWMMGHCPAGAQNRELGWAAFSPSPTRQPVWPFHVVMGWVYNQERHNVNKYWERGLVRLENIVIFIVKITNYCITW